MGFLLLFWSSCWYEKVSGNLSPSCALKSTANTIFSFEQYISKALSILSKKNWSFWQGD